MAESNGAAPKPGKRSFFKKSSWQIVPEKPQDRDDPTQMFSRAKESFREIIAEEEQRRRAEERAQKESLRKKQLEAANKSKKRKITEELLGDQREDVQGTNADTPDQSRKLGASTHTQSPVTKQHRISPTSLSARHSKRATEQAPQKAHKNIIPLDDSDDSVSEHAAVHTPVNRQSHPRPLATTKSPTKSPTQFPGYSSSASLTRLTTIDDSKLSPRGGGLQNKDHVEAGNLSEEDLDTFDRYLPDRSASPAKPVKPAAPEPAVDVLVTCKMPGFQEQLVIKIPYSMRFGVVRQEWCKHQNLPPEVEKTILLTYKGKKLWNSTSSRSIGITLDNIDDRGGPILEATTERLLAEAKQRELKALQALLLADEDSDDAPAKPRAPKFKLTLKSKGYAEFKLQVHSDSTFERIAAAFRKSRNVPADKVITIMFDGEKLSPKTKISDTEIEDPECLDVYVK